MLLKRIYNFYYSGFKNLSVQGKKLWLIIIIKLIIMFAVLKIFFFQDFLSSKFDNDKDKSEYIYRELTKIKK
jgi:hypothetical protein